ncbi:MAG: plasmid mobilization relaxosome protein MobC [Pseudanabaena sp. M38BS1SP1A06MG]|nr:plasmid mobilization relaxosome protein MobC [Pseudanabaena sp. M53BS1SP1A06MG]MCA6592808.1 plasmid mobilization relaxosome protein MobC [Pseudanabaena sp. M38BS1SP1A06MG]
MTLDERITIRISKEEKDILQQKADGLNLKLNKLARLKLIHVDVDQTHEIISINWKYYKQLNKIDFQLKKIGTNINQLAHNANLSMQMGSPMETEINKLNELSAVLEETKSVITDACSHIKSIAGTPPTKK